MFKNIEKKKELTEKRKFYLEQMKWLAENYENLSDKDKELVESILKTLGQISIQKKQELDNL